MRVLLAEDEPVLPAVTRRILARHGYTVLVADDAPGTVEPARSRPGEIHLLLTDAEVRLINKPFTGASLLREIRRALDA